MNMSSSVKHSIFVIFHIVTGWLGFHLIFNTETTIAYALLFCFSFAKKIKKNCRFFIFLKSRMHAFIINLYFFIFCWELLGGQSLVYTS